MSTNKASTSEIRKHYYLDEYVVIAPKRKTRPFTVRHSTQTADKAKKTHLPIENDPAIFEITDDTGQWLVKVVANKFPALSLENPRAYGKQEVVLETSHRQLHFCELPVAQITRILETYQQRISEIKAIKGIKHISIFKNRGYQAGSSLDHTHSQIIAASLIPPKVQEEARVFGRLKKQFGSSPLGAALEWEREEQVRIAGNSMYVTAVCPYASRFPLEVWLIPHRPVPSLIDLNQAELHSMATMLKGATKALDSVDVSYNYYLHEGLVGFDNHFVIKIAPRSTIQAGFELDTGIIINPELPENAARWYRRFLK